MSTTPNAEMTRQNILIVAAEEIHVHGFQACKTSTIIQKAGISKGALYHHFASKQVLGYAVIDEIYAPKMLAMWEPVFDSDDPIAAMIQLFRQALTWICVEDISKGCPMNNLAQEMSPVDEGFRLRISDTMTRWQSGIEKALNRAKASNCVKANVDAKRTAVFLVSSIEGGYGLAKNAQNIEIFSICVDGLIDYLETLQGGSNE